MLLQNEAISRIVWDSKYLSLKDDEDNETR